MTLCRCRQQVIRYRVVDVEGSVHHIPSNLRDHRWKWKGFTPWMNLFTNVMNQVCLSEPTSTMVIHIYGNSAIRTSTWTSMWIITKRLRPRTSVAINRNDLQTWMTLSYSMDLFSHPFYIECIVAYFPTSASTSTVLIYGDGIIGQLLSISFANNSSVVNNFEISPHFTFLTL